MRLLVVLTSLVASTALAAKPTFQDVLKKFPLTTLPLTIKDPSEQRTRLTPAEVEALGVLQDAWKSKPARDEKKALWPIARIQRSGYQLLLIRFDDELPKSATKETFLFSFNDKGSLLGSLTFHLQTSSETAATTNLSTLDQIGMISRLIKVTRPMTDPGLPPELVITSEQRAKVTSTGGLEMMAPAWSTRSGTYVDHQSREELRVFTKRVFHRPNDTAPFQELLGDGNNLRFKDSPRLYVLTWDDRRSAISCQNPDGAVQLFTREW